MAKTQKELRIAQLACFAGNIGDNANIAGTRIELSKNLNVSTKFTDLDILDFAWGLKKYDDAFINQVNQHDLFIIGGGGFFELNSDKNESGTAIGIDINILKQIKVPIVFHALGVDCTKGVPDQRLARFKRYLDYLLSQKQILVSVRNDGALKNIEKMLGPDYVKQMYKIPDGGFFVQPGQHSHPEFPDTGRAVAINLAGDMPQIRFKPSSNIKSFLRNIKTGNIHSSNKRILSQNEFIDTFAKTLEKSLRIDKSINIIFIPHIYKDVEFIGRVVQKLPSELARRRITVAPLVCSTKGYEYIFDLYRKCFLVLGMRFHSNVCPIGLNVPTVGLVTYPQIQELYNELGQSSRSVVVNSPGFENALSSLLLADQSTLQATQNCYSLLVDQLRKDLQQFHLRINEIISN